MPGFFHSSTRRCRQGCPRKYKICVSWWFTASSADLYHFLSTSKWILSTWELTKSKGRMQKTDQQPGESVNCASTRTLLHQMLYQHPSLFATSVVNLPPEPVHTHTHTHTRLPCLWPVYFTLPCTPTHWYATLATQAFLNEKCFPSHNSC